MTDIVDRLRGTPREDFQLRTRESLQTFREQLRTARDDAYREMTRLNEVAGERPLTRNQKADYDAASRRCDEAGHLVETVQDALAIKEINFAEVRWQRGDGSGDAYSALVGTSDEYRSDRPLTRSQTMRGFVQSRGLAPAHEELSLDRYLTGMVTGRWDSGSELERRALSEGIQSAGGYLIPTILSSQLIDLARNETQVLTAGAKLMPMENQIVDIAKWTGDPGSAWHTELGTITPSDATMGRVRFTARTLATITQVSMELLQDAPNIGNELATSFAKSFAIRVDKAALYGTGVAPEPLGLKNTSGITVQSQGVNGAVMASYDPFVDAVGTLEDLNEDATGGIIVAPRTVRELNKLKDTTGQPLRNPPVLDGLPFLTTNQIPTNLTQGTATTASDAFVGDWTKLIIGVRAELVIQPLRERYADTGAIGFLSWWRGDIQLARPAAFVNIVGIL